MGNQHFTEDEELLERYVLGTLGPEQRDACEQHLSTCDQCRSAVRDERQLIAGIKRVGREQLKERLKERLGTGSGVPWLRVAGIAATVVIIAGIGTVYHWWGSTGRTPESTVSESGPREETPRQPSMAIGEPAPGNERDARAGKLSEGFAKKSGAPGLKEKSVSLAQKSDVTTVAPLSGGAARKDELAAARKAEPMLPANEPKVGAMTTDRAVQRSSRQQSFWVQGIPIPSALNPESRAEEGQMNAMKQFDKTLSAKRAKQKLEGAVQNATEAGIILQQTQAALNQAGEHQMHAAYIPTEVQVSDTATLMTLYVDSLMSSREISSARISRVTQDSIIVFVGGRALGYRMPPGWEPLQMQKGRNTH